MSVAAPSPPTHRDSRKMAAPKAMKCSSGCLSHVFIPRSGARQRKEALYTHPMQAPAVPTPGCVSAVCWRN